MRRLSQGQLTLLSYCPRRFQHSILESLSVPSSPTLLAAQQWGDRFHLLMQQREMGLPIDPVLSQDPELQTCLTQLQATAPDLFDTTGEIFRQSEQGRSLSFNGYWFTVVYDLLRQWSDRADIIDWKTYLQPKALKHLRQDWQTRLYLYILVETSDLAPEQISMVYWFVRTPHPETGQPQPQQVRIPYTATDHIQTERDLQALTDRLTDLLASRDNFPQLSTDDPKCATCPFAVRCQRGFAQATGGSQLADLAAIAEVAI